jgi:hypothetical protein
MTDNWLTITDSNTVYVKYHPEAEFLEEIQTKVLRVFLFAIHTFLATALPWGFSSNSRNLSQFIVQLLYTVKEKGGNLIENYTPFPMVYEIHTEISSLRNSQYDAQKPQQNCTFMNSASV